MEFSKDRFTIVRLSSSEHARLRTIRLRALSDSPEAFATTLAEAKALPLAKWSESIEHLPTFVAVSEGKDVGMVRLATHEEEPKHVHLISLWVAPEARNRGVGAALVKRMVNESCANGFAHISLDVNNDNAAAIALYERMGFKPTGRKATLPAPREHIHEHERSLRISGARC